MDEDNFLERFKIATAFVWGGLHLIYFGCISNGSDNSANPVWGFLQSMVGVETYLILIAVFIGIIFIFYVIFSSLKENVKEEVSKQTAVTIAPIPKPKVEEVTPIIATETPKLQPIQTLVPIKENEPTLEEVRAKAIQGILRR